MQPIRTQRVLNIDIIVFRKIVLNSFYFLLKNRNADTAIRLLNIQFRKS